MEHFSATAAFLLNIGLTLASVAAHILTLLLAARQIPDELENGTLLPLLARPVRRAHLLLGKWAACAVSGCGAFFILFLLGWLPVPKTADLHPALLAQTLALQCVSLATLAAMAIGLSLILPRGVNLIVVGLTVFLGGRIAAAATSGIAAESTRAAARWFAAYIPDFSKWNLITRYTDGVGPVSGSEYLGLVLYGTIVAALFLAIGVWRFERKRL